ncbi:uncharacterized protein LOC103316175 [Nasonia vitripennis]|uniref:Chitin-binding type-2 domain-containing protein n=1 Tax=Nasonia vitripennis TaxID=7425 RepID=A0A7M7QG69_NASVI|nr:uncharacterized protein LOC103316175 [Nasonia vitripennis]
MRILPGVLIFSATTLCCCASLGLSFEYDDHELRPRLLSRRAIDGTRGRKHFNPKEDNFFDDYGFEKGQYHGEKENAGYDDLKSNVPGEPGIDYPAFVRIPRTTFSCIGRDRGYYADEEAGCQVFHVCDEGLVSTFLCPVGSLFSQRLLTCDWWSKVSCSKSREFYSLQQHAEDVPLTEQHVFRHALPDHKEAVEVVKDQEKEQNQVKETPIIVSVKKNENQLEKSHKQKHKGEHVRGQAHPRNPFLEVQNENSPVIRIKPVVEEDRRSRVRGQSRTNTVNVQTHHRRRLNPEVSSTELPSVTKTTIGIVNEEVSFSSPVAENDHFSVTTTTLQNEDNTSEDVPADLTVTKKELGDDVTESTEPTDVGNHNSALEYDDMEGKESIGLATSHAERKLEEEENNAGTTESSVNEVTTLESVDSTTSVIIEKVESTTQVDEAIQAKESIGLVHSKIQEKLQLYGQEKASVNDDSQNNAEAKTEESVNSVDDVKETTQQYQTEALTELPTNTQTSTEATTSYTFPDVDNTEAVPTRRTQQVRKMSGFRINVAEKRTTEATTLPYDEISSSDYEELLNSSDTSFTSTILPVTVTTEEPTTIMSNNVRRISDTVEESNAPFGVMLPLNGSSEFPVTINDQRPIGVNLLGQLISQHESQPIDLTNLEIVRSDEPKQPQPQNQDVSASVPNVRTYQHFRSHPVQQSNQQDYRNYEQQPVIATTFRNYQEQYVPTTARVTQQDYNDYQNNQEVQTNYRSNNNQEFITQQIVPTTTEVVPQQNFGNYQNQQDKTSDFNNYEDNDGSRDFTTTTVAPQPTSRNYPSRGNAQQNSRNNQANRNGRGNYRHPRIQNYDSTAVRNHFPDPVLSVNYNTYQSQPQAPATLNNYQNQPQESPKYNTFQNQPEEHSNIDTYQNQPEDATKYNNFQLHPQIHINIDSHQNQPEQPKWNNQRNQPENLQNYVNYQTHHYPENFPDYQQNYNYQSQPTTEIPQIRQKPQSNFGNSRPVNYQVQTTTAPQVHHRPQQNIDNSPNYAAQQNTKNFQSTRNQQPTVNTQNYDYPNYDSAEDIAENTNFGEFGVRISAKNPSDNILTVNAKRPKITENSNDAHTINAGLQGKAANFLWAMSQLAKTDRLPRPFTQNKNNGEDSFSRHRNTHYRNNVPDDKPRQNVNNFRSVSTNVNNYNADYNDNHQYVNVDDFAAPRFENPQSNSQKNNQQRQERILNKASPAPESPVIPILLNAPEPQPNPYNIENIPEVNTVPFDRNSQFVQVSAPDLSQYNVESTSVPSSNDQILRDPQPQSVDYSDYQENTPIPDFQNQPQPQPIDFNYQPTTQQSIQDVRVPQRNVEIVQDTQDFRPTVPPTTKEIFNVNEDQRHSNFNSTQKPATSVETEFIPSLSFDFGSDEGRKEYFEALEKGLVPNDSNARRIDGDVSSSDRATVAVEKMEEEQVQETTTSDIMDNFTDTGVVMSGME